MQEIAIKVEDISKIYKLYANPKDRLKEALGLSRKKRHKEHRALDHVSFDVKKGECVGIIGTNGAGKSTILKIITGVLNPTSGDVKIQGRISALLELGAGFNAEYTGIENVYLNGTMMGFSREEIDAKLKDILEFADIGQFVHQPVKMYSSGMFVRLAFAVAINIEPEILIVDEALSVGDVFFQAKCFKKFEEFKKMGKTILFVSHDLNSINQYCNRAILLNKGSVVKEGAVKEVIDQYKKILVGQDREEGQNADRHSQGMMRDQISVNDAVEDYGKKEAEIYDYTLLDDRGCPTNIVSSEEEIQIVMKVRFHEDIEEPVFAMTVKNIMGVELAGTNTMYEKLFFGTVKKGEERKVTFRQKMKLQPGSYLVSLGCTGYRGGDFYVYHRLYDVFAITIQSDRRFVGYYDMGTKIDVE